MNSFVAILFLASCVYGASLPVSVVENPCVDKELYFLRYYQPYVLDEKKYIECNPWGEWFVRDCRVGTKWNSWLGRCTDETIEKSLNTTVPIVPANESFSLMSDLPAVGPVVALNDSSCKYWGNDTCLNGGLCNQYPFGGKCLCLTNFTGDYCEVRNVSSWGVFGLLINESFSLSTYSLQRPLLDDIYAFNGTIDTSMVTDNVTRARVDEYLSLYKNGSMRFDMLVNYLIQDYLAVIYPWQFFLQEFSAPSEMQMGYVNSIPSLLMSAKYSYDRYFDLWDLYEDVLRRLIDYLPTYLPNIRRESELFYEIYESIFSAYEQTGNYSSVVANLSNVDLVNGYTNESVITVDMIKSKIHRDFNSSLWYAYELFGELNQFDDELGVRGIGKNVSYFEEAVANFTTCDNVTTLVSLLSESNAEIWDSLSFFGFWRIVSEFVDPVKWNSTRNNSSWTVFNGTSQSVARLLRPSISFNKTRVPVFQALVSEDDGSVMVGGDENSSTSQDEPEKLVSEDRLFNDTFVEEPEKLVMEKVSNVTVRPQKLVSDNSTVTPVPPRALVSGDEEDEQVDGSVQPDQPEQPDEPEKLVSDRKVLNATLPVAKAEKLVKSNVTTPVPPKKKAEHKTVE